VYLGLSLTSHGILGKLEFLFLCAEVIVGTSTLLICSLIAEHIYTPLISNVHNFIPKM